jgi:hypothetical protein
MVVFTVKVHLTYENQKISEIKAVLFPYDSINQNFFNYYNQTLNKQLIALGKSFLRPQSFSILMNFGQDGQQSVILMDQQSIFW